MLKKIRKMLKQQEGFTLVELMIVVVILGILSGIGIQQYGAVQERARKTAHNANVRIIESAAQMYIMGTGGAINVKTTNKDEFETLLGAYIKEMPENPMDKAVPYTVTIEGDVVDGYTVTVTPAVEEL